MSEPCDKYSDRYSSQSSFKGPSSLNGPNVHETSDTSNTVYNQQATTTASSVPIGANLFQRKVNSTFLSQKTDQHTMPLPQGWEKAIDTESGKCYYVNHNTRDVQWFDPRDR